MSAIDFPFWMVVQILNDGLLLGEALGFPEIARLEKGGGRLKSLVPADNQRCPIAADVEGKACATTAR